ncbi:MAG: ATP-dependent sacrificial sulfur transferase LarE, partial [Chloroflexota bacterium]|nr:ATP-dependent sacrificial sulfur transferase LarE [Chloroflexota bacterium]
KLAALRHFFSSSDCVAVAFSGGVDSTLVLKIAHDQLGARAVGVTAVSESLPTGELEEAHALAARIGARHITLRTNETADPRYLANPANRCYFCKTEMYAQLQAYAAREHFTAVVDGLNGDDLRDRRPGRQAAREHNVYSPLADAGLAKAEVRALSKELGLPTWDKPALACLSSRIPHGTTITLPALTQIDRAEIYLRALGIRQVRVRHLSDTARIEVEPRDIEHVRENRVAIAAYLNALGFARVALDLDGYRAGRLNDHAQPRVEAL